MSDNQHLQGQPSAPETPASMSQVDASGGPAAASSLGPASSEGTDQQNPAVSTSSSKVQDILQQSINRDNFQEEVGQVMGTLNSWWGGVKKQSASTLATLRADIDKTVSQAQADFEYLKAAKIEVVRKDATSEPGKVSAKEDQGVSTDTSNEEPITVQDDQDKGEGKEKTPSSATSQASPPAFFTKLASSTSQLQQSLLSAVQSTLDATTANSALSNPNAFRQQLVDNLRLTSARENLQLSVKQAEKLAEDYLRKGDQWVKGAEKWMEEAVKVVPPEGEETHVVNIGWDGGDWYSFSTSDTPLHISAVDVGASGPSTASNQVKVLAGSRKDALLKRLREDKQLLLVDPEGEGETEKRKAEFRDWVRTQWEAQKTDGRLEDEGLVGNIRMELVPEYLTDEQFWQRYLFHKHMIEDEEQKRKLLLQTSQQDQSDDFNWDDEPEETTPLGDGQVFHGIDTPRVSQDDKQPSSVSSHSKMKLATLDSTSPHDSEESYDLVSDQGGKTVRAAPPVGDDDSDWE
ncbi:hypothetical protein C349_02478 [Cryptococcus neoformans var. grubii Br795]|uniref:BSD domain-containing protein n=1 Tax=Cryptococcus neoformans Tu259-1 TaxID=1230072 RepID=A0A854QDI5_CRYNE|nr:hypothetical protein C361_02792 [Cryptococcus neoformans var. grubii Tu259-1]OXG51381.1 hypothetical protein C355_02270 [Cryptococcus neoformans var. grubii Th84]OXG84433.1 hypothetical protein C349_02478 [Cryptococcus neoformans var. grubii Br795]OXG89118.1 hypothetical protein C346_02425 [Cryptococcus neoformans var. grubii D17-1]OXG97016.1 hypothetical protein C345_02294 [Cryptococcus neoformans var. grubii A2-102-5]OXH13253.1 hypothetical protein J010_02347 [Cryptococcus neoformans var.